MPSTNGRTRPRRRRLAPAPIILNMMDTPVQAVVLVSGGLDSCVAAAEAALAFGDCSALGFLHVRYGQRTAGRELAAFERIADHFGVSRRLVADAGHLAAVGSSSLTAPGSPADDRNGEPVPSTYVPFRNANLLAIAVAWAEAAGAEVGLPGGSRAGLPLSRLPRRLLRGIRAGGGKRHPARYRHLHRDPSALTGQAGNRQAGARARRPAAPDLVLLHWRRDPLRQVSQLRAAEAGVPRSGS